jgi:Domain of unknown function (DUF4350)
MPASWRTSDLTILVAASVATIALTVASFLLAPTELMPQQEGSSYAAYDDGAKAAFLTLQQSGYSVVRSFEPIAALTAVAPATTTLVLASPTTPPSDQDRRALVSFLERGGRVVATGPEAGLFLPGNLPRPLRSAGVSSRPAATPSPIAVGVQEVTMGHVTDEVPLKSGYVAVFGTFDDPAVLTARVGAGRVTWWSGSEPLLNSGLRQSNNLDLVLNSLGAAERRTVLWDEYYHGHTRSVWSYLSATPLPFAALQLALIGGLAMLTFTRRRQPIRPIVVEPRTSPLEFIDTMGGLYERAGAASAAVATIRARIRRRLLETLGLPPATPDDRLVAAASERLALPTDLAQLLQRSRDAAQDPALAAADGVTIAAELQQLGASPHLSAGGGSRFAARSERLTTRD